MVDNFLSLENPGRGTRTSRSGPNNENHPPPESGRTTNLNGSVRRVYKGRNDLYSRCLSRSRPI